MFNKTDIMARKGFCLAEDEYSIHNSVPEFPFYASENILAKTEKSQQKKSGLKEE
jgi:hypothetical protein